MPVGGSFVKGPHFEEVTAGENLTAGDLLAINSSGNAVRAISTFSSGLWFVVGVADNTVTSGNLVTINSDEIAAYNVSFTAAPPGASNGDRVFLSSTAGKASITPPTGGNMVFIVGILQGANGVLTAPSVFFAPRPVVRR